MKTLSILTVVGTLAIAVPALADGTPTATTSTSVPSAQQQCRTERTGMGRDAFAALYGTNKNKRNAFGKCVSKRARATENAAEAAHTNASKECKTEEAADPAAFADKYGTGKNKRNAHGKCVSQKAKAKTAETVDQQVEATVNAAKTCKAERKADPAAFTEKYGTNKNKRNAFGKCVSKQRRAQQS